MSTDWRDQIAGHRMQVDREFADRVANSKLSRQQWGLVMTAVEFDVEHADDSERARLVADTSKLDHVLPEIRNLDSTTPTGAPRGGADADAGSSAGGGIVDSIRNALGVGGGSGGDLGAEAERLADEYARALQTHLEEQGRWEGVRQTAAG